MSNVIHCLNRGVEKRNIVLNDKDRFRFVQDLWIMNSTLPSEIREIQRDKKRKAADVGRPQLSGEENRGEKLVDVHAWCLMDNHYHLLLSEKMEGGLSLFLKKLNGGYAKYFNEKYHREGALWQGKTKKILVHEDQHFNHIFDYIHCNPLDFLEEAQTWRDFHIEDPEQALAHLRKYRWSSLLDYLGNKNFPSVISQTLLREVFPHYPQHIETMMRDYANPAYARMPQALRGE
jgi:putative transposase